MATLKAKTLSYRRAVWLVDSDKTLETYLRSASRKKKHILNRTFEKINGQHIKAIILQPARSGVILHVTAETPGDTASVLSSLQTGDEAGTVDTADPPPNTEYMDGDIFAYCRGDDVCICSSVLRDATLAWFCRELFEACFFHENSTKFDLRRVADVNKLKMINTEGVKEIELGATLYDATVSYEGRKHEMPGALGAVGKHISALFGSDRRPTPDNLKVAIVLKADGRMKSGKVIGYNRLTKLARELVDSDDDYAIVTRKNQKITPESTSVRRIVELPTYGKSVESQSAWKALAEFYNSVAQSGIVTS